MHQREFERASDDRFQCATADDGLGVWNWRIPVDEPVTIASIHAMLGLHTESVADPIPHDCWSCFHLDDRLRLQTSIQKAINENVPIELEVRAVRAGDQYSWLLIRGRRIDDSAYPAYLIGATVDVSRSKQTEEEARRVCKQLEIVTDTMAAPVVQCSADGRYTWVSREYAARFNLRPDEIVGQEIGKIVGETAWRTARLYHDRALLGERIEYEIPIHYEKLGARWIRSVCVPTFDHNGVQNGYVAAITDTTDRKHLEDAVAQRERQYRELVHALPAAVYTCDTEGRILLYNEAAVELWGRKPDENDRWCAAHKIFENDVEIPVEQCPVAVCVREGRPVRNQELVIERPDGSRRYILPCPEPLFDTDGKLVGAINMLLDINERKCAELEIAQVRDDLATQVLTLSQLHELSVRLINMPDPEKTMQAIVETYVASCDARGGLLLLYDPDRDQLYPAASAGFTREDLSKFPRVKPGPDAGSDGGAFATRAHTVITDTETDPRYADFRAFSRLAGFRSVHSTPIITRGGDLVGILSVKYSDIHTPTQREIQMADLYARHAADTIDAARNQQALRESEARFRKLADDAPAILWKSGVNGECTFMSRAWYEFTGQDVNDALGWGWLDCVHNADRNSVSREIETAHAQRKSWESDFRLKRNDGEYRWVVNASRTRMNSYGEFLGCVSSIIDITERKEAEQDLVFLNEVLEQRVIDRTGQLRALAVEVTHAERRERRRLAQVLHDDIQQLLVAIKMQAKFAASQQYPACHLDEVTRLADEAISSCRSLVFGLSPPLLQYASIEEILQWLAKHMEQHHNLVVKLTVLESPPELPEDLRALLYEITRELLFNVVKHADTKEATLMLGSRNSMVCIDVVDHGKGCDANMLENPAHDNFGLFSIRERLAVLGGRLELRASIGTGCAVRVLVPPGISAPRAHVPPSAVVPVERRKIRVLLADDHQILRQGLAKLLATHPDTEVVGQASDGLEAVEMARALKPDIIIMDVSMPRMTGLEATRVIRAEMPESRIVGLSMHESDELEMVMRDAGAFAYINKSGPLDMLLNVLDEETASKAQSA